MKFLKYLFLILSFLTIKNDNLLSQGLLDYFSEIELRIDTSTFNLVVHSIQYNNSEYLYFSYDDPDEICEVRLYPYPSSQIDHFVLLSSGDFTLIDSLLFVNNEYYRFKIQFKDLNKSNFLKLTFQAKETKESQPEIFELDLLPITNTYVKLYPLSNELFIGEEKVFELITNNIENVKFLNDWQKGDGINYRVTKTFNQLQLHLIPNSLGSKEISIPFHTNQPFLNDLGRPEFNLPPVVYTFNVKQSRLQFLHIDKREVTLDDSTRLHGIEIQMDNTRLLTMQKTYRVENQEDPGGALIAEIFTRNAMTNNRALCILRVYNYHRESDGYLYIKDGDQARFITNFNITPKTHIDRVSILREGNWTNNLSIHPGETLDLKIEGQALHKANFALEELFNITTDSAIRSENLALFKFKVPLDVSKKNLNLYNHGINTGHALNVREYQEPRPFDFLWINYDGTRHPVNDLPGSIMVENTIGDVIFDADQSMIDSGEKLFGKQYLKLDITITGRKNELLEIKTIDNIVVCPSATSPRHEFYSDKDCGLDHFNLNRYIRKKTHSLDIWSQINLEISHQKDKYGGEGFTKEFDLILKKDYSFDIEVSFPAGLITVSKPDENDEDDRFGQLSGISIAMIAQFTFYHPEKINTPRPYKVGAGFLALNTFNFSDNSDDRDIGIVVLGSLYPTTRDVKLTFPLYFGGGYLLKDQKFFFLLGPGIRIRL